MNNFRVSSKNKNMATSAHESLTFSHELSTLFSTKLEGFINSLCDKYGMTPENIIEDWKEFSGKEDKSVKSTNSESPSMNELKKKCREYGLKVGGKKKELLERIRAHEAGEVVSDSISVKDLKDRLKKKGLKTSGNKEDLIKRLTDSEGESDCEVEVDKNTKTKYKNMKLMELRLELKTRGCATSGNKDTLISRLIENDDKKKEDETKLHNYYRRMHEDIEKKGVYHDFGPPGNQSRTPQPVKTLPSHVQEFIDQDDNKEIDEDYVKMSIKELKGELTGRALSTKGDKEEMMKRLMEDDECESSDSDCECS